MDDHLDKLGAAISSLENVVQHLPNVRATGNQSSISINAAGQALWIAITACVVMLVLNACLAAVMVYKFQDYDRKIERAQDYQAAAYFNSGAQSNGTDNHNQPGAEATAPAATP